LIYSYKFLVETKLFLESSLPSFTDLNLSALPKYSLPCIRLLLGTLFKD
jgi:hypothetical protein